MGKVREILLRKGSGFISIQGNAIVIDALKLMADNNIGSVIVMNDADYIGIITERDYSRKVLLQGRSSQTTKAEEIMSVNLPVLSPEDSIEKCMELMSDKNTRYLPVFEENKLISVISMSDVVKQIIISQQETIHYLENYIHQG